MCYLVGERPSRRRPKRHWNDLLNYVHHVQYGGVFFLGIFFIFFREFFSDSAFLLWLLFCFCCSFAFAVFLLLLLFCFCCFFASAAVPLLLLFCFCCFFCFCCLSAFVAFLLLLLVCFCCSAFTLRVFRVLRTSRTLRTLRESGWEACAFTRVILVPFFARAFFWFCAARFSTFPCRGKI